MVIFPISMMILVLFCRWLLGPIWSNFFVIVGNQSYRSNESLKFINSKYVIIIFDETEYQEIF